MKKLLAIALIIFSSSALFAQNTENQPARQAGKFTAGLMVSPFLNWSNANVDNPDTNKVENSSNPGIAFGLVLDYFFSNNYGFEFYLRYSGYDDHFKYYPDSKNITAWVDRTLHMQTIELPVTLKMRTNEVGYMKYFAQIGVAPSVKIHTSADITASGLGNFHTGNNQNITSTDQVNIFMISSVIGLGAEYNLGGSTNVVGSICWNNAFTNIWHKNNDANTYSYLNSPIANISLNVGFFF